MRMILFFGCAVVAALGLVVLPQLIFGWAPIDEQLYFNQKIFYYHVPAALGMFVAVFVCGIASVQYLRKRDPAWDDVAWAAGDMVVLLGAMVLTSGPIWAKIAWGQWWVWDARLTNSLLLWMIFLSYSLVRRYGGPGSERLAAGLGIFGMVDVPLVYFAVNLWKTMHPTNNVVPSLKGEMRVTFWLAFLAFMAFIVVLLRARVALGRTERRLERLHEMAIDAGKID